MSSPITRLDTAPPAGASVLLTAAWAALHTLQYGFGISALNGIQDAVMCPHTQSGGTGGWLSECVPLSKERFGLVVAIFTLGGLLGSLSAGKATALAGRVGVLRLSALGVLVGSSMTGVASSFYALLVGRIVIGFGCGLATVTVPLYLAEIAPPSIKKSLGIANQFFIVIGILIGQSLSFPFSQPGTWRWVFAVAAGIAALQLLGSLLVRSADKEVEQRMEGDETEPLLPSTRGKETMGIWELLRSKDSAVSRGLALVLITQLVQQLCGISPVMYFSKGILTPVFKENSKYIALCIVILKIPITTLPAFLIDRVGSKPILLASSLTMSLAALLLAIGLNTDSQPLCVGAILSFVAAFSVGLGPVTWVVLPEVMPPHAVTPAGSVGLALNWSGNFAMGAAFLPLQEWLAGWSGAPGEGKGEGNVFYLFSALCALGCGAIWMGYRARERV